MRYISEVNGEFKVHEDPICLIDAVKSIAQSQLLANIGIDNDVRLTGQNLETISRNKCQNLNFDRSNCIGQGLDGTSNRSSSLNTPMVGWGIE